MMSTAVTPQERLLAIATAELGYIEKTSRAHLDDKTANAGNRNYTKYARDLDAIAGFYNGRKQGHAWCDVFVDWCFVQAFGVETALALTCQPRGSCGAGVLYSARYYQRKGQFFTSSPQPLDQIFFGARQGESLLRGDHTGLVCYVDGKRVYTIEGNTSAGAKVISNGGEVCRKSYLLSNKQIIGYGRPDWSLVHLTPGLTAEEDEDMDVERFTALWHEMRQDLQDNDASAWSQEARDWCIANGIMAGGDPLPGGVPNYMFHDVLTREQMCVMLYRFARLIGKA